MKKNDIIQILTPLMICVVGVIIGIAAGLKPSSEWYFLFPILFGLGITILAFFQIREFNKLQERI